MTPLDEMRAGFEAKHPPAVNVAFRQESNDYWIVDGSEYLLRLDDYNLLWQGYQSAMEDRGEVVLWRVLNTDGEPFSRWNEGKPSPDLVQKVQSTGRIVQIAYTSPQPAPDQWNAAPNPAPACDENPIFNDIEVAVYKVSEPDQWNAAIEAAANAASRAVSKEHAELSILALRKGA